MLAGLRRSKDLCLSEGQTLAASIVNGLPGPFPRVGRLLVVWTEGLLVRPAAFERDSGVDELDEALLVPVRPCVGVNGAGDEPTSLVVVELLGRPGLVCEQWVEISNVF